MSRYTRAVATRLPRSRRSARPWGSGRRRPRTWDLLVNTTPVGTAPHLEDTPLDAERLAGGRLVYDLVYNPGRTRLLRDAAAAGCATLGGLEMLIAQAAVQVATWFPVDPPIDAMRTAIHAAAPELALETSCPR